MSLNFISTFRNNMLKKEIIWREILYQATEKNIYLFQQKEIAEKFNFSLSTVFNALKIPRQIKALEISGRGFKLINIELRKQRPPTANIR